MAVGLSGNLVDFGIAEVFQLIGQQRKTGVLELKNESNRAQLVFDRGLIVSAVPAVGRSEELDPLADRLIRCGQLTRERAEEAAAACRASAQTLARTIIERGWLGADAVARAEELVTRDTIFDVLSWHRGSFDFHAQQVSHDRDASDLLGAEQILMDGLRMVDEWQSFTKLVPSLETVFQRVGPFDRFTLGADRGGADERARAERVFGLIDGRLTARRVIDLAQLGIFDGTRCLAELHEAGVIGPAPPEGVRELQRRTRSSAGRALGVGRAAAALLPVVALALVVWWTAAAASLAHAPAHRIERATLASLRETFSARAVRHAIEVYRLSRGEWPEQLDDLESAGLLAPGALATPPGRPYYSMHREQGLIFLEPER